MTIQRRRFLRTLGAGGVALMATPSRSHAAEPYEGPLLLTIDALRTTSALLLVGDMQLAMGQLAEARNCGLRVRSLPGVRPANRARAAFLLGRVDASRDPPSAPEVWFEIAASDFALSSESVVSGLPLEIDRWRRDWKRLAQPPQR